MPMPDTITTSSHMAGWYAPAKGGGGEGERIVGLVSSLCVECVCVLVLSVLQGELMTVFMCVCFFFCECVE